MAPSAKVPRNPREALSKSRVSANGSRDSQLWLAAAVAGVAGRGEVGSVASAVLSSFIVFSWVSLFCFPQP
jgi:hypothetical protein